jgi:hypothetical protein
LACSLAIVIKILECHESNVLIIKHILLNNMGIKKIPDLSGGVA